MTRYICSSVLNPLLARVALAASLAVPFAFAPEAKAEDAHVLPKGRSRLSFIYGYSGTVTHTFNPGGERESLTQALNVNLSPERFKSVDPRITQLVNFLNASGWHYNVDERETTSHGLTKDDRYPLLGDSLSLGFLGVDARAYRQQFALLYNYGLTDTISVGFGVPFVKTQVTLQYAVSGVNTANDIYHGFFSENPAVLPELRDSLNQIRSLTIDNLQEFLVSKGYSKIGNYEGTGPGDVQFGGRWNYLNHRQGEAELFNSLQLMITMPTGKLRPPNVLTQVDDGQGAWDAGLGHLANFTPSRWMTLSGSAYYTYRFATQRPMRVRRDPSEIIPDASTEELVDLRLGDKYWAVVGADFNLVPGSTAHPFSLMVNYEWFWKRNDRYQGAVPGIDYQYLGDLTDSYKETLNVGAKIRALDSFLAGHFPAPLTVEMNYYYPTRGRNAVIAPYGVAELALFF